MAARVKICGLSTPETLRAAVDAGADFVGLVAYARSPRAVEPGGAAALLEAAGLAGARSAKVVAVTVDPDDALLEALAGGMAPDLIQLHGAETPARAAQVRAITGAGIIKCLSVSGPADLEAAEAWSEAADHLMFDARTPEGASLPGGMGLSFDWSMLKGRVFARPWFLAGGLTPDNVAQALDASGAPMLDVSSGVESAPGVKEPALIAAFVEAVRATSPR
ncbi:MAG: phosphoribosylanthranilate isomerase [Brevundimonas sp.]